MTVAGSSGAAEVAYLLSARAVRERAEQMLALGERGALTHFSVDTTALPAVAARVVGVTRANYPRLDTIPYHSRWRHFGADRLRTLNERLAEASTEDRLRAQFELVIPSVLLDAGAGTRWNFREPSTGVAVGRSEGLALASFHLFVDGGLSSDPARPLRADAAGLAHVSAADIARAFAVRPDNPLPGVEGRADLLRRLGDVVATTPRYFGGTAPRLGNLADYLLRLSVGDALPATAVLGAVLEALGPIWPGRQSLHGVNLGDTWMHPQVGLVPFHKLSQWLTYSLLEPLEQAGIRVTGLDDLTGLAEYRNGGLFVDGGVLVPKQDSVLTDAHVVGSAVVVEWRALTVALLDRTAAEVQRLLGVDAQQLPLAKVLEGGTWNAGRQIAKEKRPDGGPPIRVDSDGTVF